MADKYFDDQGISYTIEDIINGMTDWVRVIDRNGNILFLNKAMSQNLSNDCIGEKCYKSLGRSGPCEICTSRSAVFNGKPQIKEEIINGRYFSVMSSPVRNSEGKIAAVVEVLRDITELKQLQKEITEQNKKLKRDLDMAKRLQCSLLPSSFSQDNIKFSYLYKPCETLSGDLIDIYKIDDENIGLYIADVSGHGVSASMLTVFLRSTIDKKELSPAKALGKLYEKYNLVGFEEHHYITVFLAVINTKNPSITFANAGHNAWPILLYNDSFELLKSCGVPLSNWLEKPIYKDSKITLEKGNRIFFYTDGLIEVKNEKNEYFDEKQLIDILMKDHSDPDTTLNNLFNKINDFRGNKKNTADSRDDITMAVIQII